MSNSTSRQAVPSTVTKLKVLSNKQTDKFVDLTNGLVRLMYYESVLQDTIRSEVVFADTGNSVDNKSVLEGLPLVGTEDVELEFKDNNDTTLKINLNVNKVTQVNEESTASMIKLDLVSEEFLRNESGSSRLNVRFDGKISDHVRRILTDFLKTEKKLDIEETNNNYNFIGNNRKPYYVMNWLSKASIPTVAGEKGKTGGFLSKSRKGP